MEVLLNMHKQSSNQNEFIIEVLKATEELMSRPMKKKKTPKKDIHQMVSLYHILIEHIGFWSSRQDYNLLVQKFLNKEVDGFQFQEAFLKLWYSDRNRIRKLIQTIEDRGEKNQIPDFCYTSKATVFHEVINNVFFMAEGHESDANESNLRSFIQEYYFPTLRKHFDD